MNGSITTSPSPAHVSNSPKAGPGQRLLHLFCRYLLGGAFLLAAITKITAPLVFVEQLELHSGLPLFLARVVGIYLPWLELTCGFCLVLGYAAREAAALVCGLLLIFLVYHFLHLHGGDDCHCFLFPGWKAPSFGWWPPVRDLLLLLCGVRAAWR